MKKIDYMGKKCKDCKKGTYGETSLWDDWDGKLHCSECGHEVKRYEETMIPTLKTLTVTDIAKIGVFWDEYSEKFRRVDRGPDYKFHKAAYRVIKGEARAYDEEMVKEFYEDSVHKSFTKKGTLSKFVRINVYDKF